MLCSFFVSDFKIVYDSNYFNALDKWGKIFCVTTHLEIKIIQNRLKIEATD